MKTDRTRLRREHHKGCHDRSSLYRLLDEVPLCHLAFVHEGQPYALPTLQWRDGDRVYWHGSSASRLMRACDGAAVCLTVTRIDGLVLARSAYEHTANFESAVVLGTARRETDDRHCLAQLERFVDSLFPGRWPELRPMSRQELKATAVMSMSLDEASVKRRSGPPSEPEEDQRHPAWGGVLPIHWTSGAPQPDAMNTQPLPAYLHAFQFARPAG